MNHWARLSVVLLAAASTGCSFLAKDAKHDDERVEQNSRVDKHSSFPALRRSDFEAVNLIELIDPEGEARRRHAPSWADPKFSVRYDLALAAFRNSDAAPWKKRIHRNSVQDRIMAVATSRCNVFKTYLRREQSDVNFGLGTATTVAGVLGSLVSGPQAPRNLAGLAGIFSGIQAEFNANYYSSLAAHVIIQGIEVRQAKLMAEITTARQVLEIDRYSMESAIQDAISFDGSCATYVGLMEASDSIREVVNPGLPRAAEVIAAVKATGELMKAESISALSTKGQLKELMTLAAPVASPLIVRSAARAASAAKPQDTIEKIGWAAEIPRRMAEAQTGAARNLGELWTKQLAEAEADKAHATHGWRTDQRPIAARMARGPKNSEVSPARARKGPNGT